MKEYTVIFEKGARNWSAYIPDLPGCVSAAETLDETRTLIQDAIALHIESMRAEGESVPEPTTEAAKIGVPE